MLLPRDGVVRKGETLNSSGCVPWRGNEQCFSEYRVCWWEGLESKDESLAGI